MDSKLVNEQEAYDLYADACKAELMGPYNFEEWRVMGRPKTLNPKDGAWPTPWPNGE